MSGAVAAVLAMVGGMLRGIMSVGNSAGVAFGFVSASYGTLTPGTYVDKGGTTRTVAIWNWDQNAAGAVSFRLSGTAIPNTDTTFASIDIGGRILLRSAATYTANDAGLRTQWNWSVNTSTYPGSGTIAVGVT